LVALLTPVLSPGGRALDLLEREMPELYQVPVCTEWASWQLLLVGNWSDRPQDRALDLESLGLSGRAPLHVFDFWQRSYRCHTGPRLPLGLVAPHASHLLRLSLAEPARLVPCLVGDTLHITQGLEIADWEATEHPVRITLRDLGRRVEGELWLHLPGARLAAGTPGATCGGKACPVRHIGREVYAVEIRAYGSTVVEV
jgi:hypothetical protein